MSIHATAGPQAATANDHGQPGFAVGAFTVKNIGLGRSAAAFGDNIVRGGLCQGLEDHLGHEMTDLHSGRHGRRKLAVDHCAFGRGHPHGANRPFIDGDVRIKGAFDAHENISIGKVVNHVATPVHLGRSAVKINVDIAVLDIDGQLDGDVLAFARTFNDTFIGIHAVRNAGDGGAHALFRTRDDLIGQIIQAVQAFIFKHFEDLFGAYVVGRHLGADVPGNLLGGSHVPADHLQHLFVKNTGVV